MLAWYAGHARDLPWRRTSDPYAILVSEVMSQQTQVARVVPRYEAWLERWPTAAALAGASVPDVLTAWVGLGYNSRALRLREACAVVARDGWPRTSAGLLELPGVGPYTAAAVASFAFAEPIAAVDTNVRRVAARLGHGTPDALLPAGREADWNQAAMELGALVCRARVVACDACPAAPWCASRGAVPAPAPTVGGPAVHFQDTNRWVRGRIVASLAAGDPVPEHIDTARVRRALDGLVRDGLVRETDGVPQLSDGPSPCAGRGGVRGQVR